MNNIRLTLEAWNRYETYLITKLDMALKMVNEVGLENVGVIGDTFHMNIEESNMEMQLESRKEIVLSPHCRQ